MLMAFYGTLKSGRGNNRLLSAATFVGEGQIEGHRLYQGGIPYVVQDWTSKYRITVEVYNVPAELVPAIDRLEGHPTWYCRRQTDVYMHDGAIVEAWVYKMDEQPEGTKENTTGVF